METRSARSEAIMEMNSVSLDPRSRLRAALTPELTQRGPGVKSFLGWAGGHFWGAGVSA